ncbi:HET-domain-containing protein, partial [Glonium stellatum]
MRGEFLDGWPATFPNPNLHLVKEWILECEQVHQTCSEGNEAAETVTPSNSPYYRSFRVIDVRKRLVISISPENLRYIALSYVWGLSQEEYLSIQKDSVCTKAGANMNTPLPSRLPKTIDDAMTACLALGADYLWADLFCIDQNDSEEKDVQLSCMGYTYRRALLTIVATYGNGSESGLPGINGHYETEIPSQIRVHIGGFDMITGLPTLSDQIVDSIWAERGWTFQEGLLAKRCLIFGGAEPVFLCG